MEVQIHGSISRLWEVQNRLSFLSFWNQPPSLEKVKYTHILGENWRIFIPLFHFIALPPATNCKSFQPNAFKDGTKNKKWDKRQTYCLVMVLFINGIGTDGRISEFPYHTEVYYSPPTWQNHETDIFGLVKFVFPKRILLHENQQFLFNHLHISFGQVLTNEVT